MTQEQVLDKTVEVIQTFEMTLGQLEILTKLCKVYEYKSLSQYMLEASLDQARRDCDRFDKVREEMKNKLEVVD
jgi:hypothetical protein